MPPSRVGAFDDLRPFRVDEAAFCSDFVPPTGVDGVCSFTLEHRGEFGSSWVFVRLPRFALGWETADVSALSASMAVSSVSSPFCFCLDAFGFAFLGLAVTG